MWEHVVVIDQEIAHQRTFLSSRGCRGSLWASHDGEVAGPGLYMVNNVAIKVVSLGASRSVSCCVCCFFFLWNVKRVLGDCGCPIFFSSVLEELHLQTGCTCGVFCGRPRPWVQLCACRDTSTHRTIESAPPPRPPHTATHTGAHDWLDHIRKPG